MGIESYEFSILLGICTFNFCLEIAILLFLLKLWLDVYHKRWLDLLADLRNSLDLPEPTE